MNNHDSKKIGNNHKNNKTNNHNKIREIEIIAKNWEFIPNKIVLEEGDKVLLKIKSIDVAHGMLLPTYGIHAFIGPGKEVKIELHADTPGEFDFRCNVPCGIGHNDMRGKLIVKPKKS